MVTPGTHIPQRVARQAAPQKCFSGKPLLIYSEDADVARSLVLLLENSFPVEFETTPEKFRDRLRDMHPAIVLMDLNQIPSDIMRMVDILLHSTRAFPVVTFAVYRNDLPEMEKAIRGVSDIVLYKPINAELVTELVSVLMAVQQEKEATFSIGRPSQPSASKPA